MSCKHPVAIVSDKDDDDQDSQTHPSKDIQQPDSVTNHCKHHILEDDNKSSSNGSNKDDHDDDADEEDVDDGADDLQELDDDALVSVLTFEVMVFSHNVWISLLFL